MKIGACEVSDRQTESQKDRCKSYFKMRLTACPSLDCCTMFSVKEDLCFKFDLIIDVFFDEIIAMIYRF